MCHAVHIRPFTPDLQDATRDLVLEGLVEHWGHLDEALNPDLRDIAAAYRDDVFLVAVSSASEVVGTGAVRFYGSVGEVVRMSIHRAWRRRGLGSMIADSLVEQALGRGATELILETTAEWLGVRAFYEKYGFVFTHLAEGAFGADAYYRLPLRP